MFHFFFSSFFPFAATAFFCCFLNSSRTRGRTKGWKWWDNHVNGHDARRPYWTKRWRNTAETKKSENQLTKVENFRRGAAAAGSSCSIPKRTLGFWVIISVFFFTIIIIISAFGSSSFFLSFPPLLRMAANWPRDDDEYISIWRRQRITTTIQYQSRIHEQIIIQVTVDQYVAPRVIKKKGSYARTVLYYFY